VSEAAALLDLLRRRHLTVAIAEGDTGGVLLGLLTAVAGSSASVLGGVVAYADDLKRDILGVPAELIVTHGSVSAECVEAMARGVAGLIGADLALATTGIAGPGGARPNKPVGLAFVAAASAERTLVRRFEWRGDRQQNRSQSADAAIQLGLELLAPNKSDPH
jgi:PncC family amidohydrolase